MKVFAISDMHGRLEGLDPKGADLVVVAGDFGIMCGWSERDLNDQVVWANTKLREWCASCHVVRATRSVDISTLATTIRLS